MCHNLSQKTFFLIELIAVANDDLANPDVYECNGGNDRHDEQRRYLSFLAVTSSERRYSKHRSRDISFTELDPAIHEQLKLNAHP
jgi:hypothetical protein